MQFRDSREVFTRFLLDAWTPERPGFMDALFSTAIRRSGLHSYENPFPQSAPPSPEEFNSMVRCRVSTLTPGGPYMHVGVVVEGWRTEHDLEGESHE